MIQIKVLSKSKTPSFVQLRFHLREAAHGIIVKTTILCTFKFLLAFHFIEKIRRFAFKFLPVICSNFCIFRIMIMKQFKLAHKKLKISLMSGLCCWLDLYRFYFISILLVFMKLIKNLPVFCWRFSSHFILFYTMKVIKMSTAL